VSPPARRYRSARDTTTGPRTPSLRGIRRPGKLIKTVGYDRGWQGSGEPLRHVLRAASANPKGHTRAQMASDNVDTVREVYTRVLARGRMEDPATSKILPELLTPRFMFDR
jgi:hypothetical protein